MFLSLDLYVKSLPQDTVPMSHHPLLEFSPHHPIRSRSALLEFERFYNIYESTINIGRKWKDSLCSTLKLWRRKSDSEFRGKRPH